MKQLLTIIIFLTTTYLCLAQNNEKSYQNMQYKLGIKLTLDRSGVPKFAETSRFRELMNAGILFSGKISKLFHVETGIYYIRKNSDVSIPYNQALTVNYSFQNIRLPMMIRLETKYFYTSVGIYGDYYVGFTSEEEYFDDKFYYDINNLNAGINIYFGIESRLSDHINIFIETGLSRDLTPFVKNGQYFKFLNYGFSIGSTIKI